MNTDKHGSEIEQLRKENQRLQQDRDAAIRQLADEGRTRGAVELERDRLRDENRRLRDAAITVMDRVGRAGVQGWSMQQFLEDGSVAELVDALAQPAPASFIRCDSHGNERPDGGYLVRAESGRYAKPKDGAP